MMSACMLREVRGDSILPYSSITPPLTWQVLPLRCQALLQGLDITVPAQGLLNSLTPHPALLSIMGHNSQTTMVTMEPVNNRSMSSNIRFMSRNNSPSNRSRYMNRNNSSRFMNRNRSLHNSTKYMNSSSSMTYMSSSSRSMSNNKYMSSSSKLHLH